MDYFTEKRPLADYLSHTSAIDHMNPKVQFVAKWLMDSMMMKLNEAPDTVFWSDPEIELTSLTFNFVRDRIALSCDKGKGPVFWRASDVLDKREGVCYGKAHLLAALLRCQGIPAALCYQYLRENEHEKANLVIHGLNAVYFQSLGRWVRLDASGGEGGQKAAFTIDNEQLAYPVQPARGETDLPLLMVSTDLAVQAKLDRHEQVGELLADRPLKITGRSAE